MSSMMAWDTRTGEIVYSLPRMECGTVYKKENWDRVFADNPDYPRFIKTSNNGPNLTTLKAQKLYRVVDGELLPKPKPLLTAGKAVEGKPCEVTLSFENLLPTDDLGEVQARFEGKGLEPVNLMLEIGKNVFVFDVLGELILKVTDGRVQTAVLQVEVEPDEGS